MFSDKDIKNSDEDLFDRKHFSERIAQIISKRTEKESIVIGIHTPWGECKTSVLNMIVENLDEHIEKKDNTLFYCKEKQRIKKPINFLTNHFCAARNSKRLSVR